MDSYALYINLAGLAVIAVGCLGLIVRAFRHWRKGLAPMVLIGFGLVITGFPPAYRLLVPIDLGPRERIVDGQRHITLTGWDRNDYTFLGSKHDVAVLQMANPDVTDRTLELLKGMNALKDLDLNNPQGLACTQYVATEEHRDHRPGFSGRVGRERIVAAT